MGILRNKCPAKKYTLAAQYRNLTKEKTMKKTLVKILFAALITSFPMAALSAGGHDHGSMKKEATKAATEMKHDGHGDHAAMMKEGDMIMLGDEMKEGVKGMAHLKDVGEAMAKMGMKENYHFMIMFMDAKTGSPIEEGTVAVKITDPSGKEAGAPVELMGMDGHFGADIALTEKGEYHFKVGTKLPDSTKRQYHFHHVVK